VSFVTEYGDAAHALIHVAHRVQANLVVVGRSAKTMHHLAGSLSHRRPPAHLPQRCTRRRGRALIGRAREANIRSESKSDRVSQSEERSTASEIVPPEDRARPHDLGIRAAE
jgi:hypothetical protein